MNCQQINCMLDATDANGPGAAEQAAIERHLESCAACRTAWTAFTDVAALEIPEMSDELAARIAGRAATLLPPRAQDRRRAWLAGSVLVFGAAAAMIGLAIGDRDRDETAAATQRELAAQPVPSTQQLAASEPRTGSDDPEQAPLHAASNVSSPEPADPESSANVLDPRSLVIVIDAATDDPEARAALDRCHERAVARLSALEGLNVIAGSAVSAYRSIGLGPAAIARELGAGAYLELGSLGRCQASIYDAETGGFLAGQVADASLVIEGASRPPGVEYDDDGIPLHFFDNLAAHVSDKLLADETTLMLEARSIFLNPALSEGERLAGLARTSIGNSYFNVEVVNTEVIAGLSQIMTSSTEAQNRRTAVLNLRGVTDPAAVDPLLHVLAYDEVTEVRRVAASVLHEFVDEPRVREALVRVVAEDPDDDDSLICCEYTLAQAARRALLSDAGLRERSMDQLKNTVLAAMERMLPLVSGPDGRGMGYALNREEARIVFEIGSVAQEPAVRSRAWNSLNQDADPNPDFLPTLLADLESHADDEVRRAAAQALTHYADDPVVRSRFEQVLADDPCECVRTTITRALEGHP